MARALLDIRTSSATLNRVLGCNAWGVLSPQGCPTGCLQRGAVRLIYSGSGENDQESASGCEQSSGGHGRATVARKLLEG